MRFTLYYRGLLTSNGGPKEKHELRRHFHRQLKELWTHKPLSDFVQSMLDKDQPEQSLNVRRNIGAFDFAPLVCEKVSLLAELNITMFRPHAPGKLVGMGGDLDNRIKTLLDALKIPSEKDAIPKDAEPSSDESPFFCLLEDDKLITTLKVGTERLLEPGLKSNEVILLVEVTTRQVDVNVGTVGLG